MYSEDYRVLELPPQYLLLYASRNSFLSRIIANPATQIGILAHAFPPSRTRSIAFATFAAGAPLGGAFGLAIGGVLTQLTKCVY